MMGTPVPERPLPCLWCRKEAVTESREGVHCRCPDLECAGSATWFLIQEWNSRPQAELQEDVGGLLERAAEFRNRTLHVKAVLGDEKFVTVKKSDLDLVNELCTALRALAAPAVDVEGLCRKYCEGMGIDPNGRTTLRDLLMGALHTPDKTVWNWEVHKPGIQAIARHLPAWCPIERATSIDEPIIAGRIEHYEGGAHWHFDVFLDPSQINDEGSLVEIPELQDYTVFKPLGALPPARDGG